MNDKLSDWEKRYSWQHKLLRYRIYDEFLSAEEVLSVVYPLIAAAALLLGIGVAQGASVE